MVCLRRSQWLFVDLVSCMPFGYISYMSGDDDGLSSGNRGFKLLRLLRLLRVARVKRILERWEEKMYGNQGLKMVKVVMLLTMIAHCLACWWYYLGRTQLPTARDDDILMLPYRTEGWVHTKYVNFTEVPISQLYFDSFFWGMSACLMISSVRKTRLLRHLYICKRSFYQDRLGTNSGKLKTKTRFPQADDPMNPTTIPEQVSFLVSFFIGAMLFSYIIGTISDIIAHSNPGVTARNDAVGQVHAFLNERGVRPGFLRQVRGHVSQLYENRGSHMDIAGANGGFEPFVHKCDLSTKIGSGQT
jgi:hypothetical protein